MKKIKEIKEEIGEAVVNFKNGTKQKVLTKTIYTYYEDGTNDCKVILAKPLASNATAEKLGGN
jgi:hypothetical protein